MTRSRWLNFLVLAALAVSALTFVDPAAAQTDDAAATETLGLINQWRLEQGLSPLRINPTLQKMAEDQARFVLQLVTANPNADIDYHADAQGRNAIQRAIQVFKWPNYGNALQVEIGENAAEFPPVKAFNFWQTSSIHRKAALGRAYREAGIVALRNKASYVIILTLGGRPGIYPVLLNRADDALYLTNEYSRYARVQPDEARVRFFDADRQPLTDSWIWRSPFPLPEPVKDLRIFWVQISISGKEYWTQVDRSRDIAILPGSATTVDTQAAAVALIDSQPTPTSRPPTIAANTPTTAAPTSTPGSQPTQTATPMSVSLSPTATATQGATSTSVANPELAIIYDTKSLIVYNSSTKPINLTSLTVGTLTVERWSQVATFPVTAFPAGHCLQAVWDGPEPAAPTVCKFVRSQIQVPASRLFWTQAPFAVTYAGAVVQTCEPTAGRCEVDLP